MKKFLAHVSLNNYEEEPIRLLGTVIKNSYHTIVVEAESEQGAVSQLAQQGYKKLSLYEHVGDYEERVVIPTLEKVKPSHKVC